MSTATCTRSAAAPPANLLQTLRWRLLGSGPAGDCKEKTCNSSFANGFILVLAFIFTVYIFVLAAPFPPGIPMSLAYTRGIAPGSTKWRTWCREGSGGICRTRLLSVVVSKTLGSSFVNKTTKKKIERPNLVNS